MISAGEFLKWLSIFGVKYGPGVVSIPVTLAQGGTGADLTPVNHGLVYSTASVMAILATANNGVLVTSAGGVPSISSALPSGLTIPGYLLLSGGTMTGPLVLSGLPTVSTQAASKAYVDSVAAGFPSAVPVEAGSTASFDATYNNGAAGVGATLTANSTGVVLLDSITTAAGQRYLFKDQTDGTQNGIYTCTVAGDVGVAGIFTRVTDYDTPSEINGTGIVPIINGATLAATGWLNVITIVTIGVTALVYIRFGSDGTVTSVAGGTGLSGLVTDSGSLSLAIPVIATHGGTGLTTIAANALLYASAPNTFAALLTSAGGVLGVNSAGAPTYTANPSADSRILLSVNGDLSVWSTSSYPSTNAINTLLYASSANVMAALATANNGVLVTSAGGVPSISSTLPAGLTIPGYQGSITPAALTEVDDTNVTITLGGTPSNALLTAVSITMGWTGELSLARGGSGAALTASNGGIVYSTASVLAILAGTGVAGRMMQSGANAAPTWSTATYPATAGTAGNILTSDGTNFVSSTPAANNAITATTYLLIGA